MHGDCLDLMKDIPDRSVDMVMCDPPYETTACTWDSIIPFEPMWAHLKRIVKPNGAIVMTGSQPFTSALVMSNLKMFKYEWIWDKHIPRGFQIAKYRPMMKHENVLVFGNGKINYFPQKKLRDRPVTVKNYSKTDKTSSNGVKYNDKSKKYTYTHKSPDSMIIGLWEPNAGKVHTTQKPVSLMEYLINTYTDKGEVVLDFAMGSGTTGVACLNIGRKFIGIEKDAIHFKQASDRIEKHKKLTDSYLI